MAATATHGPPSTSRPHAPRSRDGARIVGDLLQRVIYHTWFHLGQAVAVRRLLGHEKVPQFVGNTDQQASYRAEAGGVE